GCMGLVAGVMLGAVAGGVLGPLMLSWMLPHLPAGAPKFPVAALLFFGCPLALAGLGGAFGLPLGPRVGLGPRPGPPARPLARAPVPAGPTERPSMIERASAIAGHWNRGGLI